MSWLYSQALVEAYSAASSSAGAQSARSKSIDTPQAYCAPDKMIGFYRLSRFGMTFGLLTEELGVELLTSCLRDFRATTSALPVRGPASQDQKAAYGLRWQESFAKYSRVTCTWRTHQRLLDGAWMSFSGIWPRQGTMRNGVCWERTKSAPRISEREFGYLPPHTNLPTPTAFDATCSSVIAKTDRIKLGGKLPRKINKQGTEGSVGLARLVQMWPTPTVHGNYNRKGASKTSGNGLATAVKIFPTPTAHNAQETACPVDRRRKTPPLDAVAGGKLNPPWVEWLMGWPLGWTGLQPLEKDKYQQWLQQHSDFYTTE